MILKAFVTSINSTNGTGNVFHNYNIKSIRVIFLILCPSAVPCDIYIRCPLYQLLMITPYAPAYISPWPWFWLRHKFYRTIGCITMHNGSVPNGASFRVQNSQVNTVSVSKAFWLHSQMHLLLSYLSILFIYWFVYSWSELSHTWRLNIDCEVRICVGLL